MEFLIDGDFTRNGLVLLGLVAAFEQTPCDNPDGLRAATRLFNFASLHLYRYGRPCCARTLCHEAVSLIRAVLSRTGSPYLYLLWLDQLMNIGRIDRGVGDEPAAVKLFLQIARAVRGGEIFTAGLASLVLDGTIVEHLDLLVPGWACDWWTRAASEVIKTRRTRRQFTELLEDLSCLEEMSFPASKSTVCRGRVEANLGLRNVMAALNWHLRALAVDSDTLDFPCDYLHRIIIFHMMGCKEALRSTAEEMYEVLEPMEGQYSMSDCEMLLNVSQVCYQAELWMQSDMYLSRCIECCKQLGSERVYGMALTEALRRAISKGSSKMVCDLCQQLKHFLQKCGYLHLRRESYRVMALGLELLGHVGEAELYFVNAELWARRLQHKECSVGACVIDSLPPSCDSCLGTLWEVDTAVTEIFERMMVASQKKRSALR